MIGSSGLLIVAAVTGFMPIILAAIASRFFRPELLRSVPVQLSASGTFRTSRDVRSAVAIGGEADVARNGQNRRE